MMTPLPRPTRACLYNVDLNNLHHDDVYIGHAWRAKSGKSLAASLWTYPFKLKEEFTFDTRGKHTTKMRLLHDLSFPK